jgi:hypothetical protein
VNGWRMVLAGGGLPRGGPHPLPRQLSGGHTGRTSSRCWGVRLLWPR